MPTTTIERAQREFHADGTYLNTATQGLLPQRGVDAVATALDRARRGLAQPADYDPALEASRRAYAELVGVRARDVAVGSQVSVFTGLLAAGLADGAEVLTAAGEFTSIVFPFLAQHRRGVTVREVPLERLAEAVTARTALVSVSAVQSADGRVADVDALVAACAGTDTRVLLDTTQAAGWLPVDAGRVAYTVCAGYKWLLAPRGTAFATVAPELVDELVAVHANWFAGEDPWASLYGGPLRLAPDARRFDVSPAWHSWVGQAPALALLLEVGRAGLAAHSLRLADRFRAGVGLAPGNSAIVSTTTDAAGSARLAAAGVRTSVRDGRLRLSFHVNNTDDDVDRAVEALGHVRTPDRAAVT